MSCLSVLPQRMLTPADLDRRGLLRRAFDWLADSRSHRVLCLLFGLWLINIFDLVLTILAHHQGQLTEQNPIAARLLPLGPEALTAFKVGTIGAASIVLIRYRRHFAAEICATFALGVYALVAVRWRLCYELYALANSKSLTSAEVDQVTWWKSAVPSL